MATYTHIVVGTNDMERARTFYDRTLGALGLKRVRDVGEKWSMWGKDQPEFMVCRPANGEPATHANGGTICFVAATTEAVDKFYAEGLANGGKCEGPAGPRAHSPTWYSAYLRDPDGNKICAIRK